MATNIVLTWNDIHQAVDALLERWKNVLPDGVQSVYGIPTGGSVVASLIAGNRSTFTGYRLVEALTGTCGLVVDDLIDSGRTMEPYANRPHDALYRKPTSPKHLAPNAIELDGWLTFPWEKNEGTPEDAVVRLLEYIGEDPNRPGLLDTPARVCKAWTEMTAGYKDDAAIHLSKVFPDTSDEMVVVSGIEFTSLCEHHVLPFTGTATVAYVPDGKVVGLSKIARCVESFSKRLQVQERLTDQIAEAMMEHLNPKGVAVMLTAQHACMAVRGVQQRNAVMTTSCLRGCFYEDSRARNEFLVIAGSKR